MPAPTTGAPTFFMVIEMATEGIKKKGLIDTSSAIILIKSGLFNELIGYYDIKMAESVYNELTVDIHVGSREVKGYRDSEKIKVIRTDNEEPQAEDTSVPLYRLDEGERDTILLFLKGHGDMIVIDDGKGAAYCRDNGIPYINSLLVPRILSLAGLFSQERCSRGMMSIIRHGRYSQKIIDYAINCPREKLCLFFN